MAVLERLSVVPGNLAVLNAELAERAHRELGYRGLQDLNYGREKKGLLLGKLIDAGVPVYSPESVARYKYRQASGARLAIGGILSLAAGIVTFAAATSGLAENGYSRGAVAAYPFVAVAVMVGCFALRAANRRAELRWERKPLRAYGQAIPLHVLDTALKVGKLLPGADFMVEELGKYQVIRDPFLVVHWEGAEAHIAVWDEPDFEAAERR